MNIETNETTHVATVDGYDAEILRVLAEKSGQTPEELILSFFERGAMHSADAAHAAD